MTTNYSAGINAMLTMSSRSYNAPGPDGRTSRESIQDGAGVFWSEVAIDSADHDKLNYGDTPLIIDTRVCLA